MASFILYNLFIILTAKINNVLSSCLSLVTIMEVNSPTRRIKSNTNPTDLCHSFQNLKQLFTLKLYFNKAFATHPAIANRFVSHKLPAYFIWLQLKNIPDFNYIIFLILIIRLYSWSFYFWSAMVLIMFSPSENTVCAIFL